MLKIFNKILVNLSSSHIKLFKCHILASLLTVMVEGEVVS